MPAKKPTSRKPSDGVSHRKGDARKRRPGAQPSHPRKDGQGFVPKRKRGAQPGNTNALKSGRRSKRLKKLIVALMSDPEIRSIVLALATAREADDIRRFDHIRFLRSVAGLKQSIRRYAALVDGSHRSRVLDSLGLSAGFPPGNVEAAGPDMQSTASTAKPSVEHGPQSAQPNAKPTMEHGPQSAQPTAKPTEGWPRTNTPNTPSPDTTDAHFSQTNDSEFPSPTLGKEPARRGPGVREFHLQLPLDTMPS
ncbi:MAG: hypothetical protein IH865_05390 [Chloroflexi bacterium]|nr:hypothetical protein [Chloroflexota bacterium]